MNLAVGLWSLRIKSHHFAPLRLCALARMSLLIQAVVLAKAQRRKGRKGKILAMVGLNSQRPSTHGERDCFFTSRQRRLNPPQRQGHIQPSLTRRRNICRPYRGLMVFEK